MHRKAFILYILVLVYTTQRANPSVPKEEKAEKTVRVEYAAYYLIIHQRGRAAHTAVPVPVTVTFDANAERRKHEDADADEEEEGKS